MAAQATLAEIRSPRRAGVDWDALAARARASRAGPSRSRSTPS